MLILLSKCWQSSRFAQLPMLAVKMTSNAVLEYHGKAYSVFERFNYLSNRTSVPVHFRGYNFQCVLKPRALLLHPQNKEHPELSCRLEIIRSVICKGSRILRPPQVLAYVFNSSRRTRRRVSSSIG